MNDRRLCLIYARLEHEDMRHYAKKWRRTRAAAYLHAAKEHCQWLRFWQNKAASAPEQPEPQEVAA